MVRGGVDVAVDVRPAAEVGSARHDTGLVARPLRHTLLRLERQYRQPPCCRTEKDRSSTAWYVSTAAAECRPTMRGTDHPPSRAWILTLALVACRPEARVVAPAAATARPPRCVVRDRDVSFISISLMSEP